MKLFIQLCFTAGLLVFAISAWSGKYTNPALNPVIFKSVETHSPIQLVKDGKLNFAIVYDSASEKNTASYRQSIHQAVEALKDAFKKSTGQTPPVIDAKSADTKKYRYLITVGKNAITDKLGMQPLKLPVEGFEVKTFPDVVAIAGHDGSLIKGSYNNLDSYRYRINGTANGAYDFIERVLGLRFYYPGIGNYVPAIKNLTLEPVDYTDAPEYKNRYNWAASGALKDWPWPKVSNDNSLVDERWRMAISTRYTPSHSPRPELMGKTFPDKLDTIFYRDPSGHLYYNPATHMGNLYDVSNPAFADILVDCYKKFYATDGKWQAPWANWYPPNSEYVIFGQTDTTGVVIQNNRTAGLIFPKKGQNDIMSDVYAKFYIDLAERLKKELPGKKLNVMFYESYTMPPEKIRNFPDNIRATICLGTPAYIKSSAYQKYLSEIYKQWTDILKHPIGAWTYSTAGSCIPYALQGRYMGDFIQLLAPYLWSDLVYWNTDGMNWHFYYSYYPVYRSMWNKNFNVTAALDEHWKLLYGPAAPYLKKFYDTMLERWEKHYIPDVDATVNGGKKIGGIGTELWDVKRLYQKAYPPVVIDELEKLLQQAEKAVAPGSIEHERVMFFIKPWATEFTAARAYSSMDTPLYKAKKTSDRIVIDGKIDERTWQNAETIAFQDAGGQGKDMKSKPELKILWADNGLYIAYQVPGKVTAIPGNLWNSDNLEMFLSPGIEKNDYCQIAISAAGEIFSGNKRLKPFPAEYDKKWKCDGLEYKANVSKNGWELEMFIPFKGLNVNPPAPYKCWFANFIANQKTTKDYGSFALTMGNNHNIELLGIIKFMGKGE